ncbi:MAG TPA: S9 family peptidase, partial [Idiomarina sp.]|nr:S9 family peptidase [Idiomarina sp.]
MKYVLSAVAVSVLVACSPAQNDSSQTAETQQVEKQQAESMQVKYPETRKGDTVDTYFDTKVKDPYRWLEDDRSAETEAWVEAQNEVTFNHLEKIPFRDKIEKRLTELWNYEKVSAPFKEGDYTYYYKNDGLQNQYVVYRKKNDSDEEEVFLDPNTFSEDGTTSLAQLTFSEDGKLAAYSISEGGSDWRKIIVIDAETKERLEDPLVDVKFSGISWKGNEGFYYSSYDKPEGSELSAKTDQHKLYYHELGTPQSDDELVFGGTDAQKHRYVGGYVTDDNQFLVISAANSTSGNKLFIKDLSKEDAPLVTVVDDYDSDV